MAFTRKSAQMIAGKAQFKTKYGVDLTDEEYAEYQRRVSKVTLPFGICGGVFGLIAFILFINMINSDYASDWAGPFVFVFIMACGSCGVMNSQTTKVARQFAAEIKSRRPVDQPASSSSSPITSITRVSQNQTQSQSTTQINRAGYFQPQPAPQSYQKPSAQINTPAPRVETAAERAAKEKGRMEKLKKLVKVSERLKISQMAQILGMDETNLYDRIVDWAAEYGFTLDEDIVKFGAGRKDDFIAALDGAFQGWDKKTETKEGKLE